MNGVVLRKDLSPGLVLARDLESHALVGLDPSTPILLSSGTGEMARAGQCYPGERGWIAIGRQVAILRRALGVAQ